MSDPLDTLYSLITEAIIKADRMGPDNPTLRRAAYAHISLLEEQIADCAEPDSVDAYIARRGAMRAALVAHQLGRAYLLGRKFRQQDVRRRVQGPYREMLARIAECKTLDSPETSRLFALVEGTSPVDEAEVKSSQK